MSPQCNPRSSCPVPPLPSELWLGSSCIERQQMRFHMLSLPRCKPRGKGPLVSAPKRPSPTLPYHGACFTNFHALAACSSALPDLLFLSSLSSGHRLGRRIGPWERSRAPSFSRSLHQHCVILSGRRRLVVGTCYSPSPSQRLQSCGCPSTLAICSNFGFFF